MRAGSSHPRAGNPVAPAAPAPTGAHRLTPVGPGGDGGDFRDIHPFTAGNRLRRIDWKATAREGRTPATSTSGGRQRWLTRPC